MTRRNFDLTDFEWAIIQPLPQPEIMRPASCWRVLRPRRDHPLDRGLVIRRRHFGEFLLDNFDKLLEAETRT
ncbi:hypothetical protein [Rhizobium leguminosarum]